MQEVVSPAEVQLTPFSKVIEDFRQGRLVILIDHANRENEGDLAIATEKISAEDVAFMMRHGRGLICVSIGAELADTLDLPLQSLNNASPFNTPFAVSVDHRSVAAHGVTAAARAYTMRRLLESDVKAEEFVSPGHVFPLVANAAGVIGRQGQTEGSYDLARIAGMKPSGVICEILNADGTMARGRDLNRFVAEHQLSITSVDEILRHRIQQEILVREVANSILNTDYGQFKTFVFADDVDGKEHLALVRGVDRLSAIKNGPLVRIHSECLTGDVFGSRRCDCGEQLSVAMQHVVKEGVGIIIYLRQEGRGIGLTNKLRAYELQDRGHDTVEANVQLGFKPDERDFAVAAKILGYFGVDKVRLLTNNPAKVNVISKFGIDIVERIPLIVKGDEYSKFYLQTKRDKLGHWL